MKREIREVSVPVEKKFKILSEITRATYFAWRETAARIAPDRGTAEVVKTFWEIMAKRTAESYLKRIDRTKPLPRQIAECMVWSSVVMGEDARIIVTESDDEAFVYHKQCPWHDWHKKLGLLEEDRRGCDTWFFKTVEEINRALGTSVKIETVQALPTGGDCCMRRLWCE